MSALLYAIADGPAPADGADLRFVGDGPVAVVGPPDADATPDALRAHMRTVSELMRDRAVLPVRYGTQLEEPELERLLQERREPLAAALDRVRGAVEVAVHARIAAAPTSEAASPRSGTEYLMRRAGNVDPRLLPLAAVARAVAPAPRSDGTRLAYLVDRDRLAEFVGAVRALDHAHPDLELVCTGPWPPYSFSEGWL
ncbi:MAG TPA: GvpL/GvpF family gas vesicle protein [Solirubrobacteraceae bacterium]|nr:GvpL/GvpF family gas vesicle protein [Solirubrobacteraceae bacterium]